LSEKPLKIIFFRHSLLGRGGDKMIVCQANRLVSRGHHVVIRTSRVSTHFTLDERVEIKLSGAGSVVATLFDLFRLATDFDLLIVDIIPLAILAGLRFGRRRVLYYCQDWDVSYYQKFSVRLLIRFFYWFEKTFLRLPVIVVADHLLDKIGRRDIGQTFVVENGIDLTVFNADLRKQPVFSSQEVPSILIFLRPDLRKGSDLALRLIKRLAQNYAGRFRVVSVGESCPEMLVGVTWDDQGTVDEYRLSQLLNRCDLFLYPSRHEGFGLMAVEAFACRCLLLTTTAVPFAQDGWNALVAPVADAAGLYDRLCTLLDGRVDAEALVCRAADFAATHSISACTEAFATVVEGLEG